MNVDRLRTSKITGSSAAAIIVVTGPSQTTVCDLFSSVNMSRDIGGHVLLSAVLITTEYSNFGTKLYLKYCKQPL